MNYLRAGAKYSKSVIPFQKVPRCKMHDSRIPPKTVDEDLAVRVLFLILEKEIAGIHWLLPHEAMRTWTKSLDFLNKPYHHLEKSSLINGPLGRIFCAIVSISLPLSFGFNHGRNEGVWISNGSHPLWNLPRGCSWVFKFPPQGCPSHSFDRQARCSNWMAADPIALVLTGILGW